MKKELYPSDIVRQQVPLLYSGLINFKSQTRKNKM